MCVCGRAPLIAILFCSVAYQGWRHGLALLQDLVKIVFRIAVTVNEIIILISRFARSSWPTSAAGTAADEDAAAAPPGQGALRPPDNRGPRGLIAPRPGHHLRPLTGARTIGCCSGSGSRCLWTGCGWFGPSSCPAGSRSRRR